MPALQYCNSGPQGVTATLSRKWHMLPSHPPGSLLARAATPCPWCALTIKRPKLHAPSCLMVQMSTMTPAQELQQMYAGILPSLMDIQEGTRAKRPPQNRWTLINSRRRSRAKGQGKGKETDHQDGNLGHHQQLQAVARLLLRHDAQLNRLAQDTTVLCTFTNKPEAILPHLYQISAEWKKRMESSQKPSMSLRVTIFQVLLELKSRLQKIVASEENKAVLRRQGYLSPTGGWLFLRWEPGTESLKPVPDRSMSHS